MSNDAVKLPGDPAVLKAVIAALQAESVKISATLRAHLADILNRIDELLPWNWTPEGETASQAA